MGLSASDCTTTSSDVHPPIADARTLMASLCAVDGVTGVQLVEGHVYVTFTSPVLDENDDPVSDDAYVNVQDAVAAAGWNEPILRDVGDWIGALWERWYTTPRG